jgi:hypothetical protein
MNSGSDVEVTAHLRSGNYWIFRVWSSGICGGQSGVGAGFLRVLRFPLPFIPPNYPFSKSPGAGTIGQWMADVPSGSSSDSTPPTMQIKKKTTGFLAQSLPAALNTEAAVRETYCNLFQKFVGRYWWFEKLAYDKKGTVFFAEMLCSSERGRRFVETYHLHIEVQTASRARSQRY